MKRILLLLALLPALAASAAWQDVSMDVYRNWFGEELPHLEALEMERVKPDIVLRLEEPTARNIFGRLESNCVARLAACIIRGTYVPEEDGKVFFTLAENTTRYRLFIDRTGKGEKFEEVVLLPHPKLRRLAWSNATDSWRPSAKKSCRVFTSREPLSLRKDRPVAFKVHFLAGFYGEGVSLQTVADERNIPKFDDDE